MKATILNEKQLAKFNKDYNTNLFSVIIEQKKSKYYAILNCDENNKFLISKSEVEKYLK